MTVKAKQAASNTTRLLGNRSLLLPGLAVLAVLLVLCILWSITLGAADITPDVVFQALFNFDSSQFDHLIIQTVRLPRVLAGALVGAGLAVAGAIMQGLTRNPLADSGILGINAGAAFVVVMAVYLLGNPSLSVYAIAALIGAAAAAVIVYGLGSVGRGGPTTLRLTLAGVILTAFASSLTTAILIQDQETLDQIRFW
ncbi:MAG: iron chelate uptake ABC transporter family permease subunit, partial [Anaerolineae bacterium]|nr:iron chelate uptake ABC transporter family permease subunit [Anaerolineae bacterium]